MKGMFKSKRFVAFVAGILMFMVLLFTTDYSPIEVATGVTLITGIYIGAQSLRGSNKEIG